MNNSNLKSFTFPCLIGNQGGRRVLTISINFEELSRVVSFEGLKHTLARAQRELNQRRASRFASYVHGALVSKTDYIIPPLIGNIDGDIDVQPSAEHSTFGMITIPLSARIELFDGQHRNVGIFEVCEQLANLHSETVTLELSENQSIEARQQFFSDINGNASKPNAAINLAYDRTNLLSQMVREVISGIPLLHNLTDFERTNMKGRKGYWVSFKALCDASGRFVQINEDTDSEKMSGDLRAIWEAWCVFTGLSEASQMDFSDYSSEWLTFTAVLINGFGFAVQTLLETMTIAELCSRLHDMAANTARRIRDDFFLTAKWEGVCVSKETGKINASIRGQRAAAGRFVEAIRANDFSI